MTDTAWAAIDLNTEALATMPPYLVDAAPSLPADWLRNPDPELYTSWEEFAKQLFWDFHLGEAFVLATARYATGWPARFHVIPAGIVEVEMDAGRRFYTIGNEDVTSDILHFRYQGSTTDARGHGPLEVAASRVRATGALNQYASTLASAGGIPASVLEHPEELSADQALELRQQWVAARTSSLGEPAVLSGGVKWTPTQLNPTDMALLDLAQYNEARIAVLLHCRPVLLNLPSAGDSLTYANVSMLYDAHWRIDLRPLAKRVTADLSGWLLPRGTTVELNHDAYVQPGPLERAQTYAILNGIVDADGNPAISVAEIRQKERLDDASTVDLPTGVLK